MSYANTFERLHVIRLLLNFTQMQLVAQGVTGPSARARVGTTPSTPREPLSYATTHKDATPKQPDQQHPHQSNPSHTQNSQDDLL